MEMLDTPVEEWGRPPDDLIGVLADIAVGGPGPSFLRPLDRVDKRGSSTIDDLSPQQGAARLAWAFRSVINSSEADQIIMRGAAKGRRLLADAAEALHGGRPGKRSRRVVAPGP